MATNNQQPLEIVNLFPLRKDLETDREMTSSNFYWFSFSRFSSRLISNYSLVGIELIIGLLLGFVLMGLNIGAGSAILGGISAGALVSYSYRFFLKKSIKPNTNVRKLGQAIVGLTIGFSIAHTNLANISLKLPILILTTLLLLLSSFLIGYIYSRIGKIELLSSLLAVTPGNIGVMASLAADYGRDVSLISLVQIMRFTAIILIIPALTNVSIPHDVTAIISSITQDIFKFNPSYLLQLFLVVATTLVIARTGNKFKIPAAYLLCSICVGIAINSLLNSWAFLLDGNFSLPPLMNLVGQTLLGITIGEYWGINPHLGKRALAYTFIPVFLTCFAAFTIAVVIMFLTHWDWLTCLLMAAPGGSPEMILIALILHHDVETITAAHLVRLMAINLYLPILLWAWDKYALAKVKPEVLPELSIKV